MRTLGVDPGLFGAVALWDDDLEVLVIHDAPIARIVKGKSQNRAVLVDGEYARIIRELAPDRMVIEEVGGIKGQSASASFNFGAVFGVMRGIAAALNIPVHFRTPQSWRMAMRVAKGKDGSRLRATQIFPTYAAKFARVKDHDRAEAALMARCPIS